MRIRSRRKELRTGNVNQIRGLLAEYGIVLPQSLSAFNSHLPEILEDAENGLTWIARTAVHDLYQECIEMTENIKTSESELTQMAKLNPTTKALMRIRGIGPITALALYACMGTGQQFQNARQVAAWLGLVPQQQGTGGKMVLGPISKRGNRYVRVLLIHGARTVLNWMKNKTDTLSLWAKALVARRGKHKAIVATANKTARMVWVVLNKGVDALPKHYLSAA